MSHEVEPTALPGKQTLRRRLRAQRRSAAGQRDRIADAAAIAAAAGALVDSLCLPPPPPAPR